MCKYKDCNKEVTFGSGYCWGHYAGVCAGLPKEPSDLNYLLRKLQPKQEQAK